MPAVEVASPAPQAATPSDLEEAVSVQQTPVPVTGTTAPRYSSTSLKDDLEELGRGGETHKAVQAEFKRLAETRGFRATIERQLPNSLDKVDLYLERDGVRIACEVSVTNTLEYEMRNITKCLRAGVTQVLVLAVDSAKHQRLSGAIAAQLPADQQKLVLCLMKDDFVAFLDSMPPAISAAATSHPVPEKAKMVKGWKVRTNAVPTTDAEVTDVEKQLAATMAENFRRRATKKRKKK